jgi:hypothetical protein
VGRREGGYKTQGDISKQSASFHHHTSNTCVRIEYYLICWFKECSLQRHQRLVSCITQFRRTRIR